MKTVYTLFGLLSGTFFFITACGRSENDVLHPVFSCDSAKNDVYSDGGVSMCIEKPQSLSIDQGTSANRYLSFTSTNDRCDLVKSIVEKFTAKYLQGVTFTFGSCDESGLIRDNDLSTKIWFTLATDKNKFVYAFEIEKNNNEIFLKECDKKAKADGAAGYDLVTCFTPITSAIVPNFIVKSYPLPNKQIKDLFPTIIKNLK